jgi:hypothetical protein
MAKAVIANDNQSLSLSIADRKFAETKASIKAIGAGVNWLSEMQGEDVSLSISFMQLLVARRKERREFQKNNPPTSGIVSESYKAKQRGYLADAKCGFTAEQIEALETKGLLGTPAVHQAIGSMLSGSDEESAKVKATLLEQVQ